MLHQAMIFGIAGANFRRSLALFDMAVHNPSSTEELLRLDEVQLYKDFVLKLTPTNLPLPDNGHVSFGHLLNG